MDISAISTHDSQKTEVNRNLENTFTIAIKWLVILGFVTLPYTHLKWMPDLGTTRPVSDVFFALAFGLIVFHAFETNRWNLKTWWRWPRSWDNWPVLRWWVWLVGLGILSAAITPLYGLPAQALTRLLGYVGILLTLFIGAYSLPRYSIQSIARWTMIGYLPALAYGLIEGLAILGLPLAFEAITWFRATFIVPHDWVGRLSLFATEPSFVAFQIVYLMLLIPYAKERWLQGCTFALIALSILFSQSGTVWALIAIFLILWGLFSFNKKILARLALITSGVGGIAILAKLFLPKVSELTNQFAGTLFSIERLQRMSISFMIRFYYIVNLVYAMIDTRGLGLGIGQYGYFWKSIYLQHIDYHLFDPTGEVAQALSNTGGDYMKPWSVILGVGVDLGVIGLALLIGFFWQVFKSLADPRHRALFFTSLVALAGAYPIVTPHIWLGLALMSGMGLTLKRASEIA